MPILFKCECGVPRMASPQDAGQTVVCEVCGGKIQIPQISNPDCVLVYRSGFPNEGLVYAMEELHKQVTSFQFTRNDLVFHDDCWVPLGDVYELPEPPPEPMPQGEDLALQFKKLPPMPGFAKLGTRHPIRDALRFLRNARDWKHRILSLKHKSTKVRLIYCAIGLFALLLGYLFGFGKVINYVLWRPAYVVVCNPDNVEYTAKVAGMEAKVPAAGVGIVQDIFVTLPLTRSLTLTNSDGNVIHNVKVPVRPLYDVLVNPGGKRTFAIYNLKNQGEMQVKQHLFDDLVKEIISDKSPSHISRICDGAKELCQQMYQGKTNDELFTHTQYNLNKVMPTRSSEYMERMFNKAHRIDVSLPTLAHFGVMSFNFKNITASFTPEAKETPCSFSLSFPKAFSPFDPAKHPETKGKLSITPVKGTLPFLVTFDKQDNLKTDTSNGLSGKVTRKDKNGITYTGQWYYSANHAASGPSRGKWKWSWRFAGIYMPKGKNPRIQKLNISYDVDYNGTIKISVK